MRRSPTLRLAMLAARTTTANATRTLAAIAFASLFVFHPHDADAAPKKKKKKPAPATATVELDAPAPAPTPPPAPPPAAPAPPPPAPEPAPAEPATEPEAEPAAPKSPHTHAASSEAPFGARHALVLDDLSGFRASASGGLAYAGPIGFSTQSTGVNVLGASGAVGGTDTVRTTTLWFAPSLDYFLFDRISIGAIVELAWSTSTYSSTIFGTSNGSSTSAWSLTVLPRVGYALPFSEHWALWPRLGMGLGVVPVVLPANATTQAGAGAPLSSTELTYLLDVDVGVLYRLDSRFFLRAGPEFTWGPGAGVIDFSLAGGFGATWSL